MPFPRVNKRGREWNTVQGYHNFLPKVNHGDRCDIEVDKPQTVHLLTQLFLSDIVSSRPTRS